MHKEAGWDICTVKGKGPKTETSLNCVEGTPQFACIECFPAIMRVLVDKGSQGAQETTVTRSLGWQVQLSLHVSFAAMLLHYVVLEVVSPVEPLPAQVTGQVVPACTLLAVTTEAWRVAVLLAAVFAREARHRLFKNRGQAEAMTEEC